MNRLALVSKRVAMICALLLLPACVEREFFIRSEPEGATVFVDGMVRGKTPVEIPLVFYGEREVELRLDGYKVYREIVDLDPPWYQIFPFDFFCEVLLPFTWKDSRSLDLMLDRLPQEGEEKIDEVLERARELREGS